MSADGSTARYDEPADAPDGEPAAWAPAARGSGRVAGRPLPRRPVSRTEVPAGSRVAAPAGATTSARTGLARPRERPLDEPSRRPAGTAQPGIRLNGVWCALLLMAGDVGALLLARVLGGGTGLVLAVLFAVVGVAVALLAGRGGIFEAVMLPGTVAVVVSALVVAVDPAAVSGLFAGGGTFRRVWDAIGEVAPAAAAAWVCSIATIVLRRTGLLRRL